MRNPISRSTTASGALLLIFIISCLSPSDSFGQRRKPVLACRQPVLAALKPMPELSYPCDDQQNDWNEKILKLPVRVAAIKTLISQLSSFSDAAWWTASTQDLSVCDFAEATGVLTSDQRQSFIDGGYSFWLFGHNRIRLVLIPDPCYQTEYGGSNAFLLYRNGDRVFVSQVLDGFYSRADNPVNVAFAKQGATEIIEISTGTGGLSPSLTNYYFAIDPQTNWAVPKNLFKGARGPTNEISSALVLSNLPASLEPLKIIRGQSLAPSFSVYVDSPNGKIDDNGRTFSRKTLRWNGKIYQ